MNLENIPNSDAVVAKSNADAAEAIATFWSVSFVVASILLSVILIKSFLGVKK